MLTLAFGTKVYVTPSLNEQALRTNAVAVTRHLQFGNGCAFVDVSLEIG
jgi:hypothetical protein